MRGQCQPQHTEVLPEEGDRPPPSPSALSTALPQYQAWKPRGGREPRARQQSCGDTCPPVGAAGTRVPVLGRGRVPPPSPAWTRPEGEAGHAWEGPARSLWSHSCQLGSGNREQQPHSLTRLLGPQLLPSALALAGRPLGAVAPRGELLLEGGSGAALTHRLVQEALVPVHDLPVGGAGACECRGGPLPAPASQASPPPQVSVPPLPCRPHPISRSPQQASPSPCPPPAPACLTPCSGFSGATPHTGSSAAGPPSALPPPTQEG